MRFTGAVTGLVLTFAGATALAKPPTEPPGRLLVSIEMREGWQPIKKRTGYWFYAQPMTGNLAGPLVTGYEYRDGKRVDEFGGGAEPDLVAAIEQLSLQSFDFDTEVAAARRRLAAKATDSGHIEVCGVRDGARWEVTVHSPTGKFRLDAWNPGATADCLAPHSEKLASLDKLFDLLRAFYADAKLQF